MSAGLVVVALVAVALAGAFATFWTSRMARDLQEASERLLQQAMKLAEMRPESVLVPPPDLRPYLSQLQEGTVAMARELAAGISLVVAGPPQPAPQEQAEQQHEQEGPGEQAEELYTPAWDTDETWGVHEPTPDSPAEWSAEWAGAIHRSVLGSSNGGLFGGQGIHLPDPGDL